MDAKTFIEEFDKNTAEVEKSVENEEAKNQLGEAKSEGTLLENPAPEDENKTEEPKDEKPEEETDKVEETKAEEAPESKGEEQEVEKSVEEDPKVEATDVEPEKAEEEAEPETKAEDVEKSTDLEQFSGVLSAIAKSYSALQASLEQSVTSLQAELSELRKSQEDQVTQAEELRKSFLVDETATDKADAPVSKAVGFASKNTLPEDQEIDDDAVSKSVDTTVEKSYTFESKDERNKFHEKLSKSIEQGKIPKNDSDYLGNIYLNAVNKNATGDQLAELNEFMKTY